MASEQLPKSAHHTNETQLRQQNRRGLLTVLRTAFRHFNAARASEAAASMAYYAFFALFPLLLVLIVVASFVLEGEVVQRQLLEAVNNVLPGSRQIVSDNIQHVLETRGTVGLVALMGLIWAAAGGFDALVMNINRAWPGAEMRGFVARRVLSLKLIVGLVLVLIVSLIGSATLNFLPQLSALTGGIRSDSLAPLGWLALLIPLTLRVVMFWIIYRWVPNTRVAVSAAFWGALFTAVGWEVVTALFALYLGSGLANYELVYGAVGAVVALMFWIYWIGWITLFGAHLSAALGGRDKSESKRAS